MGLYEYQAVCTNVVDGDTIDVIFDLGFRLTKVDRVRIYGINTPERGQPGAAEATAFTRQFCQPAREWPLRIHTAKPRDKYGRWLADVWLDGENLATELVERGLAVTYLV